MIIHGRDIVFSLDGEARLASKSCTIEVKEESVNVTSVSAGKWKESIGGMRSWSLSSSHLLVSSYFSPTLYINAKGSKTGRFGWAGPQGDFMQDQDDQLWVWPIEIGTGAYYSGTEPARQFVVDDGSELAELVTYINGASPDYFYIFCCSGTSHWSTDLQNAMKNKFGITFPSVMTNNDRTWSAIAYSAWKNPMTGATYGAGRYSAGLSTASTDYTCDSDGTISFHLPLSWAVGMVGKEFDVTLRSNVQPTHSVHGDTLTGRVRCTQANVTGNVGSLATGSFKFEGIGSLSW